MMRKGVSMGSVFESAVPLAFGVEVSAMVAGRGEVGKDGQCDLVRGYTRCVEVICTHA